MPWNMKDYPASMKNLDPLVRKKAIDIANALLDDGYPDDRAIPIATSQAEKWYDDASAEEKPVEPAIPFPKKKMRSPVPKKSLRTNSHLSKSINKMENCRIPLIIRNN